MRLAVAYIGSVVLLVFGSAWAHSFVKPLVSIRVVDADAAASVFTLIVLCGMACGLVGGMVLTWLTRPGQLRHASVIAAAVAAVSFAVSALPHPWLRADTMITALEGLFVLPFVVSMLALTAIARAKALERQQGAV